MENSPLPWRVGNRVSHNIYDANDECVGHTHKEEDAELIVKAVNRGLENADAIRSH